LNEEKIEYLPETVEGLDVLHEENIENNVREEKKAKWQFWQTPNLIDDFDLSVYAFRLYQHFKRVCGSKDGSSWQSTKTLALYCGMSTGMVSKAKKELAEHDPPLIRIEFKKKPNDFGFYHDITILDIWEMNEKHFNKEKQVFLPKLDRMEKEKKSRSSPHEQAGSPHETKKNSIRIKPIISAIADDKLCETCQGEIMCAKCEQTKKRIEIDEQYGFENDKRMAKQYLAQLESKHNFEEGKESVTPESTDQKILQMLSGHDEYSEKISEYPETVQNSVMLFVKTFKLSFSAIPKKSKGKGGMYATWIKGIQDLQSIAGNERRFKLVLDKVFNVWNNRDSEFKTHVDMPQKIRGAFVTMEAELRGEEVSFMAEEIKKEKERFAEKEVYITDNEEVRLSAVAELKKQLRRKNDDK
jgi:hypothetical protein